MLVSGEFVSGELFQLHGSCVNALFLAWWRCLWKGEHCWDKVVVLCQYPHPKEICGFRFTRTCWIRNLGLSQLFSKSHCYLSYVICLLNSKFAFFGRIYLGIIKWEGPVTFSVWPTSVQFTIRRFFWSAQLVRCYVAKLCLRLSYQTVGWNRNRNNYLQIPRLTHFHTKQLIFI